MHAHLLALQRGLRHRPRPQRAHAARDGRGVLAPIDPRLGLVELGGVGDAQRGLCARRQRPRFEAVQGLEQRGGTERREPRVQRGRILVGTDRDTALEQHRSGVEARVHLHDGDAGLGVTGEQRALDRRRTAPARQQRRVDVEAAGPRQRERLGGQDQPVGDHHHHIRFPSRQGLAALGGAQRGGLRHRQAVREGEFFDRAMLDAPPAPRGPVGLGEHSHHLVAGGDQRRERRHGELRGPGEDDAHGWGRRGCGDGRRWRGAVAAPRLNATARLRPVRGPRARGRAAPSRACDGCGRA